MLLSIQYFACVIGLLFKYRVHGLRIDLLGNHFCWLVVKTKNIFKNWRDFFFLDLFGNDRFWSFNRNNGGCEVKIKEIIMNDCLRTFLVFFGGEVKILFDRNNLFFFVCHSSLSFFFFLPLSYQLFSLHFLFSLPSFRICSHLLLNLFLPFFYLLDVLVWMHLPCPYLFLFNFLLFLDLLL